jgi:hypothetical protein
MSHWRREMMRHIKPQR